MSKIQIFTTGATGYIGGSILDRLLAHPDRPAFEITTLVRSEEKARALKFFGLRPVVGSFQDLSLLEGLAADADIIFDAVDADNLEAARAMLRGLKKRHQAIGKAAVFIHTANIQSGTGLLADNAAGMYATDKIWNDADANDIETLPDSAPHRDVDLAIIDADRQGFVKTAGISNNRSIQIPSLIRTALDRRRAGMVGKGLNIWSNVHIDDVADLYMNIFNAVNSDRQPGHGREGYYFGENGEHTLYDVGKGIGNVLVELGECTSAEPTSFAREEIDRYFGGSTSLGSNSRCRGNRSRAIGWRPKMTSTDLFASLSREVEEVMRRGQNNGRLSSF
ncbi:hypothetical protein AN958_12558 [Leucoagaricus sp. SymC.cos]|nr:hypothetical protein AN958_12558 [Leucoagaricus sp. SymC.cos]